MKKPPLDPDKLRVVVEVAQAGSLSKVALQNHSSQPYISKVIAQVEATCGGRLFRRTGRGMQLTDLGQAVLPRIQSWLAEGESLVDEIRSLAGTATGLVRVATLPALSSPVMGTLFMRSREAFPGIQLRFMEGYLEQVRHWLEQGQADLGVTLRYDDDAPPGAHHLVDFDMYLCAAPGDPLTRAADIPFAALEGLPLAVHSKPGLLHRRLQQLFDARGMTLHAAIEANSVSIQKDIAAAGGGYALLSHGAIVRDLRALRLQASRIVDPPLSQHLDLEFARSGPVSQASLEVARLLRELVREAAGVGALNVG